MKLILALLIAATVSAAAQDKQNESHAPHTIGPVTVIRSDFDYHETIRFEDGAEKEFYHCEYTGALAKGRRVYITFIGDGTSANHDLCAIGVSVRDASSKRINATK